MPLNCCKGLFRKNAQEVKSNGLESTKEERCNLVRDALSRKCGSNPTHLRKRGITVPAKMDTFLNYSMVGLFNGENLLNRLLATSSDIANPQVAASLMSPISPVLTASKSLSSEISLPDNFPLPLA